MRRFVTLSVLLLFAIPFGVSVSGCSKKEAVVFCNAGDSGPSTGQLSTITLGPIVSGISLNYAEISQVSQPAGTDCKGQSAYAGAFTYGTTDMTLVDVQPTTGRVCAGTWNRNTGGGIPDFTVCNPATRPGIAYISASAQGVTSNPLPVFVHPVVTSVVFGTNSSSIPTAAITAYTIANNIATFTAPNSYQTGQTVSLYGFSASTFFNGISNAVVQAAGLSTAQFSVSIPGFTHANTSTIVEPGFAGPSNCLSDSTATTSCYPTASLGSASAPPYDASSCISQGQTRQLVASVYAGSTANPVNISRYAGHLIYQAAAPVNGTAVSTVVSIDTNGVATANQPGSVQITAYISNAASAAGFFSTCPPASITLSAPGTSGSPVVINQNNTLPLVATAVDTLGNPLTGLDLEYETTAQTTVPTAQASVTPLFAGAASITAICQPPACNSSGTNQIGLFGNGKAVTSNAVDVVSPGTNSTVLYMASTQSKYVVARDFTQTTQSAALLLPFIPNSMVIDASGSAIYMGSPTALMVLSTSGSLSLSRTDLGSEGTVLAISPDRSQIVISDPIKQTTTIESSAGSVISTYGGVGTRAEYAPDSQTVYIAAGNQVLVYSATTGWTSISPATNAGNPVTDVAITIPAVGAYFAGQTTTARSYCSISTPGSNAGNETNVFYPLADSSSAITDFIAATNDGKHILGATVSPVPTLNDLQVHVPITPGPGGSIACPLNGTLAFSNSVAPTPLAGVTASAITGVFPTSDSSEAFVTYTGSGKVLPAYAPASSGAGTIRYIPLTGTATAPIAGVVSADDTTFYAGTSGDNLVHIINRSTLVDTSTLAPNLTDPSGAPVPVNLLVQRPRTAN